MYIINNNKKLKNVVLSYCTVRYCVHYCIGPKTQCENESKYREIFFCFCIKQNAKKPNRPLLYLIIQDKNQLLLKCKAIFVEQEFLRGKGKCRLRYLALFVVCRVYVLSQIECVLQKVQATAIPNSPSEPCNPLPSCTSIKYKQ